MRRAMHKRLHHMPIDRTQPVFTASTDANGATEAEYRDRTIRLRVLIPADGGCADATLERFDFAPQEIPQPKARSNPKPGKCGGCKKAAAENPPGRVVLRGWRVRLHRRAGRERVCASCETAIRWIGLDWCGKPRNAFKRILGYATDGCGCILNIKRRIGRAECPADKWRAE